MKKLLMAVVVVGLMFGLAGTSFAGSKEDLKDIRKEKESQEKLLIELNKQREAIKENIYRLDGVVAYLESKVEEEKKAEKQAEVKDEESK